MRCRQYLVPRLCEPLLCRGPTTVLHIGGLHSIQLAVCFCTIQPGMCMFCQGQSQAHTQGVNAVFQDGDAGIGGDVPPDMSSFEVCLWFSAVNLITAGFGALVGSLLLEGGYPRGE